MFCNPGASSVLDPDSQGHVIYPQSRSISHDSTHTETEESKCSSSSGHTGEKHSSHVIFILYYTVWIGLEVLKKKQKAIVVWSINIWTHLDIDKVIVYYLSSAVHWNWNYIQIMWAVQELQHCVYVVPHVTAWVCSHCRWPVTWSVLLRQPQWRQLL